MAIRVCFLALIASFGRGWTEVAPLKRVFEPCMYDSVELCLNNYRSALVFRCAAPSLHPAPDSVQADLSCQRPRGLIASAPAEKLPEAVRSDPACPSSEILQLPTMTFEEGCFGIKSALHRLCKPSFTTPAVSTAYCAAVEVLQSIILLQAQVRKQTPSTYHQGFGW